jgi:hypothetical protein
MIGEGREAIKECNWVQKLALSPAVDGAYTPTKEMHSCPTVASKATTLWLRGGGMGCS